MAKKVDALSAEQIRDRIKEVRKFLGSVFIAHGDNWRVHPAAQQDALAALLGSVGIVGVLVAYESVRYGGLTLIDGHMRAIGYPDVEWWTAILDVTDEEADEILRAFDPIGAMAMADHEALGRLDERLGQASGDLALQLDVMAAQAKLVEGIDAALSAPGLGVDGRRLGLSTPAVIRVVVPIGEGLADFERAIMATGDVNRAEAVAKLARFYLEHHETREKG